MSHRRRRRHAWQRECLPAILITLAVAGCTTVRLVSEYDDVTDKSATEMQHTVDQFLLKLESEYGTSSALYDANKATYDELQADVDALRVRAVAVAKNGITVGMTDDLNRTLSDLRHEHELHNTPPDKGMTNASIEASRSAFTSIFTAIITFELAKKRGQRTPSK